MEDKRILNVFIIALAAKHSGALRIVTELAKLAANDDTTKYTFITSMPLEEPGITNLVIRSRGYIPRLYFECFGIQRLLRREGQHPSVVVSLNNLAILGAIGIPQYVYIHQALPFYPELIWGWGAWRHLFYQRVYGYLMWASIRLTSSSVIVQTRTMQDRVRKCWGMDSLCWFPDFALAPQERSTARKIEQVLFIYPATYHAHKNHVVLIAAIAEIKVRRPDLYEVIQVRFTVDPQLQEGTCADPHIEFIGECTFGQVNGHYADAAALLFPSLVETVGLPLVEASKLGIPILCTDASYSREILEGYEGVRFVRPDIATAWADAIIEITEISIAANRPHRCNPHLIKIPKTNLMEIQP